MDQDLPRGRTRLVLAFLARESVFITAHDLHQRITRLEHPIGISTVYRALRNLRNRDLVDVMVDEHGQRWYRHCSSRPHHHLVCSACHSTVEVPAHSSPLPAWTPEKALGFTDVLVRVTITGTCAECAQPRSRCG
ncbi:Fur family ferric uptake transcriptional regulator [Lentzea atacamensis]|uniref:Fur family ferric uptake transcriptional regulator n=2 Tax=Lentzea TaxID=165301 RepID=A0A316HQN8_9PSEU|nr:transcriptional repressor [Lentzea atacamensis]PWK83601.1 Fur family ferric uptake transcriptional regulator [Lentzea atacamensis]